MRRNDPDTRALDPALLEKAGDLPVHRDQRIEPPKHETTQTPGFGGAPFLRRWIPAGVKRQYRPPARQRAASQAQCEQARAQISSHVQMQNIATRLEQ